MFRIGIIGCGKIAQVRHIPEYMENPEADLYGFYDINEKRAEELAEKYHGKAYASVADLLSDPEIDAVSVCAANHAHAELSIAALNAGKHVLCEKPMATTLQECEDMVKAARMNKKFLMIGHNQRLAKAHIKAKQLISQGEIGRIITARTSFGHSGPETWSIDPGKNVWFFNRAQASMGVMADLGIHKTDLLQFLYSSHITKVTARLATLDKCYSDGSPIEVDDNVFCIYEFKNGMIASMTASWTYYGEEDNSTILYGTEGIMKIYDDPRHSIVVLKRNGERYCYDVDTIQTNENQTKSGIIDLWMECLTQNREPDISGAEVLYAMKAVFAAIESSQKNTTIYIGEEEENEK